MIKTPQKYSLKMHTGNLGTLLDPNRSLLVRQSQPTTYVAPLGTGQLNKGAVLYAPLVDIFKFLGVFRAAPSSFFKLCTGTATNAAFTCCACDLEAA